MTEHPGPNDRILPGAFGNEPQVVPVKEKPSGRIIGEATVYPDGTYTATFDEPITLENKGDSFRLSTSADLDTVLVEHNPLKPPDELEQLRTEVRWLRDIIEHYGGEDAKRQLRSMDDPGGGS